MSPQLVLLCITTIQRKKQAVAKIISTQQKSIDAGLLTERLAFFLTCIIFLFAPLIRGGNRQISLVVLLGLGLLLLAVLVTERTYQTLSVPSTKRLWLFGSTWQSIAYALLILSPIWLGIFYLFPLPIDTWSSLAGRGFYTMAMQDLNIASPSKLPISLTPAATWASLLAGIPVVAIFCAALLISTETIKKLLVVLLVVTVIQVLIAILQFAFGIDSVFYFDAKVGGSVIGSFANRNHLASLLAMSLPICIYIFYDQSLKKQLNTSAPENRQKKRIILAFVMFLGFAILSMLLATLSRGGLMSGFISLGISLFIYILALGSKASRKQRIAYSTFAIVFITAAMLSSGFEKIQPRLGERLLSDAEVRNTISSATLVAAAQFWPWGTGLGSFEAVFPRFQPALNLGDRGYIEYAHNDYAQILMELGLFGALLMLVFAVLLIVQLFQIITIIRFKRRIPKNLAMQCFCGVGLLAFLMHCWVEFNMHIPALAITAGFLAGVFLRRPGTDFLYPNKVASTKHHI
ncbi:MAG: O-antigen ligase family protein [Polaromonas sp.]|nr:O-antigen ligase family protein [Polaromonas sp.]